MKAQATQTELHGKFDAPLNRGMLTGALRFITLSDPHQGRSKAVIDGEASGWSKVRARLGKSELAEGDHVIIHRFKVMPDSILAEEIG